MKSYRGFHVQSMSRTTSARTLSPRTYNVQSQKRAMDAEGKAQPPSEGAELVAEAEQLVERCRNVSNRAATFQDKQQQELDLICDELMTVMHSIEDLEASLSQQGASLSKDVRERAQHQLNVARNVFQAAGPGGDLRRYLGSKAKRGAGFALTLMIGKQTNVATFSQEKLLSVKQEYQQFRDRASWQMTAVSFTLYYLWHRGHREWLVPAPIRLLMLCSMMVEAESVSVSPGPKPAFTMFGLVTLLDYVGFFSVLDHFRPAAALPVGAKVTDLALGSYMPFVMTGVQAFLCWLLYFYAALALRENVLRCVDGFLYSLYYFYNAPARRVNGSNIRKWWIFHHYISTLCVLVLLTLPVNSAHVLEFMGPLLMMMGLQGCVMLLQNVYQRGRLYTRVALGKQSTMDVNAGESSGSSGQLAILYPVLFVFQGLQGYLGVTLLARFAASFLDPRDYLEFSALAGSSGSDLRTTRGLAIVGVTLVTLAAGNLKATLETLHGKLRKASRAARTGR